MNTLLTPRIVIFMSLILLLSAGFTPYNPTVPIEKKVAVIFIKYTDDCSSDAACLPFFSPPLRATLGTPRFSASTYTYLMNLTMTQYITEATYNHTHMVFTAITNPDSADGWFDAPNDLEDYNDNPPDDPATADIFNDALSLAHDVAGDDITSYDMILVVQNFQSLYGFTLGCHDSEPGNYWTCLKHIGSITKNISLVSIGENADNESMLEVLAHELGHVHSLPHVVMGPYDMVGNSPVLTHYGGWSKVSAGWVPEIVDLTGPGEVTAVLDPLARPGKNVVRIPYWGTGDPFFEGFTVECRAKTGFDQKIPEEGVIVAYVNTTGIPGFSYHHAIIQFPLYDNTDPQADFWHYSDAALAPGESYVNEARDLTVTHVSTDSTGRCTVTVKRDPVDSPDPFINPYTTVDSGLGYNEYISKDIWIDSQVNGWDVYPNGVTITQEGGQAHPATFGDPIWAEHENRIKYLIHNSGYGDAHNVLVDVYVTQPMRLYDNCNKDFELNDAKLIATQEIPLLEKDGFYFGKVPWTPTSYAAFEVTVVIRDYMGEITHDNNKASETYASQNILANNASAGTPVLTEMTGAFVGSLPFNLAADLRCKGPYRYQFERRVISAIDRKYWVMGDGILDGIVRPGDEQAIPFSGTLPEGAKPGDCEEVLIQMKIQTDDIYVPVDGFVYKSCVVAPSEITCKVPLASVESGKAITINGQLTPAGSSEKIAIEYTSPSSERTVQLVSTGKNGAYTDLFTPNESGKWQLQAYWQGTDKSAPAESGICQFEVASIKPEFTLNSNTNCRGGPGMDYPVYTAGKPGDVFPVYARSADALWLYGAMKGFTCWVKLELGKLNMNPLSILIRQAPVLPTTNITPSSACSNYTSESGCYRLRDQCQWVVQPTGVGKCVPK